MSSSTASNSHPDDDEHVRLGDQVQQQLRLGLDIQVDDPLAAVHEIPVFARHRQTAQAAHPYHVSTQVGEHHGGVRPGPIPPNSITLYPGEGPVVGHLTKTSETSERLFGLARASAIRVSRC